jgi:hypothetical protein
MSNFDCKKRLHVTNVGQLNRCSSHVLEHNTVLILLIKEESSQGLAFWKQFFRANKGQCNKGTNLPHKTTQMFCPGDDPILGRIITKGMELCYRCISFLPNFSCNSITIEVKVFRLVLFNMIKKVHHSFTEVNPVHSSCLSSWM